jgi:hypothetical protein
MYVNDFGNHMVDDDYAIVKCEIVNCMVSYFINIYDQPYVFQDQSYGSRSTTWFKVKNSPKPPYTTPAVRSKQ